MGRPKKDNRPLNLRIRKDLAEKLDSYSKKTGINKTAAVEKGLELYFAKFESLLDEIEATEKEDRD